MSIIPMQQAMIAASGSGGDPYWANVVSLLHLDGANGSSTITDELGKTWTPTGSPLISTTEFKFGSASLSMLSATAKRIDCNHTDFNFGTGDFTIEGWFRPDNNSNRSIFSFGTRLVYVATNNWAYFNGSSNVLSGGSVTIGTWYHVALTRSSGTTRLFVGGNQIGGGTAEASALNPGTMRIGYYNGGNPNGGYYDEFRITNGVARYVTSFTPPSAPFPNF